MTQREAIKALVPQVADELRITQSDLLFGRKAKYIAARMELFRRAWQVKPAPSLSTICEVLGFERRTVLAAIRKKPRGSDEYCSTCHRRIFSGFCSARCALTRPGAVE